MSQHVAVSLILIFICVYVRAPPPMRVTIDCPSDKKGTPTSRFSPKVKADNINGEFNVGSLCNLINSAIPKAVEDGRFILLEDRYDDQDGFGDTLLPISAAPPAGFIPKLQKIKPPRLRIPKLKVPPLGLFPGTKGPRLPPKLGTGTIFTPRAVEEETSAERMEKFKKGVQKMLHIVKVLGQIDQYISERTRIIVDKLSKTFAD
ncbi:unnamed protein product [Diatraea saccharalis]|uniref:Uncharacterized protein n=1 Tax=Diatraea saccharalis TaxID=40085 RepID=A0A9N9R8G4_9NEOP|nr:unnamed protein product [Diatraea saccharalis]